jgi:multicomponent Na+:H+ antiporter subunit D
MLAYSSISQVGYMVLGLGAGTVLGVAGAIFHLFNHATFKSLLFVNAAAVEQQTGTRDMNRMGGLAEKMPVTGWTSVIAFLSTAGIPPLAGFWSKLIIIVALWQAGHIVYAGLAVLASLLTLAYFLSMQRRVFFGKLAAGFENLKEANAWILIPACALALITLGIGIAIPWLFETFLLPIRSLL